MVFVYELLWNNLCHHIYFGMVTLPEGKMSTRKGRVVFLRDVIEEGIRRAEVAIQQKNPELFAKEELRRKVAKQVAVGAIIWSDLSKDMRRNIVFSWDEMLSFEGNSAPYVQYAHARACSILRKAENLGIQLNEIKQAEVIIDPESKVEKALIKKIAEFPTVVKSATRELHPHQIAIYALELSQLFSQFYRDCPILKSEKKIRASRLKLTVATAQVIRNALYLLGIESPEIM